MDNKNTHVPVLAEEISRYLQLKKGMVIVDCTVGGGGHAEYILEGIGDTGHLIGIDRDMEALDEAKERLRNAGKRLSLFHANFADVDSILKEAGIAKTDGAIFDLGISSLQMDDAERGFSIRQDGPLDMRMNRSGTTRASDIVNSRTKSDMAEIFKKYGDERFAFRIAERIVRERKKQRIERTGRLAAIIADALPYRYRFRKIHPATKAFMALRIAVNRETEHLRSGLAGMIPRLRKGARICVISFHSTEDRIVKNKFKELDASDVIKIITKKPVRPGSAEAERNPRSRSAKLRVGEKL